MTSAPNAKLPLPICIGVEFELACRTGLNWVMTAWRSIEAVISLTPRVRVRRVEVLIVMVLYLKIGI